MRYTNLRLLTYLLFKHANFGEDRLRGFDVARARILAFSVDLLRRL